MYKRQTNESGVDSYIHSFYLTRIKVSGIDLNLNIKPHLTIIHTLPRDLDLTIKLVKSVLGGYCGFKVC